LARGRHDQLSASPARFTGSQANSAETLRHDLARFRFLLGAKHLFAPGTQVIRSG